MATSTSTKIGHGLAKVLGIKLHYRDPTGLENLSRGESIFSVSSADTYVEQEPTTIEWLKEVMPTGKGVIQYLTRLFPFVHWIGRYNLQWFLGDLIAGTSKVWPESLRMDILTLIRRDRWRSRCPARNGLRSTCSTPAPVWSILLFCGSIDLLVLRYVQGHHHRGKCFPAQLSRRGPLILHSPSPSCQQSQAMWSVSPRKRIRNLRAMS